MEKTIYSRDYAVFRKLLVQARQDAGVTQEELAEALQIGQSMVSKVERGERRLDIVELRAWCHALGTPLERFAGKFEGLLKQQLSRKIK